MVEDVFIKKKIKPRDNVYYLVVYLIIKNF